MDVLRNLRRFAALGCLAGIACGASPAWALDDKPLYSAIMDAVGVSTDPSVSSIDYGERSRLVLPPNSGVLPEPKEGARTRPASWPAGQGGTLGRRDAAARAPVSQVSGDEPARGKLTEPPAGYRRATVDLSKIREPEPAASWTNPFAFIKQQAGKVIGGGD